MSLPTHLLGTSELNSSTAATFQYAICAPRWGLPYEQVFSIFSRLIVDTIEKAAVHHTYDWQPMGFERQTNARAIQKYLLNDRLCQHLSFTCNV